MLASDVIASLSGATATDAPKAASAAGRLIGDAFQALLAAGDGKAGPARAGARGKGLIGEALVTAPEKADGMEGLLSVAAFAATPQSAAIVIPADTATPVTAQTPANPTLIETAGQTATQPKAPVEATAMSALKAALATAAGTDGLPARPESNTTNATTVPATPDAIPADQAAPIAKPVAPASAVQTLARSAAPVLPDATPVAVEQRRAAETHAEGDRRTERQAALKGPAPSATPPTAATPAAAALAPSASTPPSVTPTTTGNAATPAADTPVADPAHPLTPDADVASDTVPEATTDTARAAAAARDLSRASQQPTGLARATIETTAMLAAGIARRLEGRSTRFEMGLTPEGLGKVDVSIEVGDDGQLAARLAFDNPVAAAELRARADELRRQLLDAGFQLAGDALEFTEQQGGDTASQDAWHRDRSAFAGAARLADAADAAPAQWISLAAAREGVDMKV